MNTEICMKIEKNQSPKNNIDVNAKNKNKCLFALEANKHLEKS